MTHKPDRLLADTFVGEAAEAFALQAAARARRGQRLRRTGAGVGVVTGIAALLLISRAPEATRPRAPSSPASSPPVEIISDAELIAALEGQKVVFLKNATGITGVIVLPDREH